MRTSEKKQKGGEDDRLDDRVHTNINFKAIASMVVLILFSLIGICVAIRNIFSDCEVFGSDSKVLKFILGWLFWPLLLACKDKE